MSYHISLKSSNMSKMNFFPLYFYSISTNSYVFKPEIWHSTLAPFLHTTHFSPVVPFLNISRVLLCLPVHVLVQALILHLSNSYNGLPFLIFVF